MWKFLKQIPKLLFLFIIRLYQKTLSPDHSPLKILFPYGYCKYQPSCSEYGYRVIHKFGVLKGVPLAIWRILRCNPCSKGGVDEANYNS